MPTYIRFPNKACKHWLEHKWTDNVKFQGDTAEVKRSASTVNKLRDAGYVEGVDFVLC